jgi:acrylyl-CoA reductase (NADPH)
MKAFTIFENSDGSFTQKIIEKNIDELPEGEVLIRVKYSSLNYKDALSATGNKGVTRKYPHTPGIDAAGIVEDSLTTEFKKGDKVIVTSYDLGMNTAGGFGQYIRVPVKWVLKLPKGLSLKESMILGTAGFTAAQCIDKLILNGVKPNQGKIVVSGSTGGVGSLAVMILAKLGFEVVAITGKKEAEEFLIKIGASEVIGREQMDDNSSKPMLKGQFAGGIDTVGGNILATMLKSIQPNGAVSICGLVNSPELKTTVFPFIIRGISMLGIDSAEAPIEWRKSLWKKLAKEWKPVDLQGISKEVKLNGLKKEINKILEGSQIGRVIVKL